MSLSFWGLVETAPRWASALYILTLVALLGGAVLSGADSFSLLDREALTPARMREMGAQPDTVYNDLVRRRTDRTLVLLMLALASACSLRSFEGFSSGRSTPADVDASIDSGTQPADAGEPDAVSPMPDGGDAGPSVDPYVAAVMADAPEGYWRLEETSGVVAEDSSGKSHDATILGAGGVTYGAAGALARGGKGFVVDGGARLVISDVVDLTSASGFTVEAWIRPAATDNAYRTFFHEMTLTVTGPAVGSYAYYNAALKKLAFEAWVNGGLIQIAVVDLQLGISEYTHVVLTNDGSVSRLYVNGTLVSTSKTAKLGASDEPMAWGRDWKGGLDELALYAKPLAAARVAAHYQAAR